jgi:uncharacterized protein (TIRG00374 family)
VTNDRPDRGGRSHPAAVFLGRLLRAGVAGGLLWWVIARVDWHELRQALAGADWRWIFAAVALVVADRALMAWRWLRLIRATERDRAPSLPATLRLFFVSTFVGTFLPGSVGGDAVRAVSLSRLGVPTGRAVASVAVDRLLGTVSVVLMAAAGLLVAGRLADARLVSVAAAASVVALAGTFLLLFDSRLLGRVVDATLGSFGALHRLGHKFLGAVREYGQHRDALAEVLVASLVVQVLRTLQTWCLGVALGISIGVVWYFAWVPLIVLVVLLPISISGLGTGNAAFVTLFGLSGVSETNAFALSVLFLGLGVLGNLPGGLLIAKGKSEVGSRK